MLSVIRVFSGTVHFFPSMMRDCGDPFAVDLGMPITGGMRRSSSFMTAPAMLPKSLGTSWS